MSLFNSKKTEQTEEVQAANLSNTIGKGTVVTGDIESHGNIRIEGKVVGNIHSKSKVVLGSGAIVEGNVSAQNAEIEGQINGKIEIKDVLTLKASAVINGDIYTNKLVTDPGAKFNGKCHMENTSVNGASSASSANKNGAYVSKKATATV